MTDAARALEAAGVNPDQIATTLAAMEQTRLDTRMKQDLKGWRLYWTLHNTVALIAYGLPEGDCTRVALLEALEAS